MIAGPIVLKMWVTAYRSGSGRNMSWLLGRNVEPRNLVGRDAN
jgi:hypothetical protein